MGGLTLKPLTLWEGKWKTGPCPVTLPPPGFYGNDGQPWHAVVGLIE